METTKLATPNTDERIGLFGGTFNPLHVGHLNCISTVRQRLGFDKIIVIPAAQNPKKIPVEGPTAEQRVEMLRVGLQEFDYVEIDDQEMKRGGVSYSVDTVEDYAKRVPSENLYLIIGLDQFEQFDAWKDYERILTLCNLVVVTRTGHQLPFSADELPQGLKRLVEAFDRNFITLTTGRTVDFVRLSDIDVSASEVRKRLRTGRNVDKYLTIPVEELIREKQLYGPLKDRIGDFELFTRFCAERLMDRKAVNIRGFDLREIDAPSEFTLVTSGTSTRHVSSLAENLVREVKEEYNVLPQSSEGMGEGRWVLLDYGSLIVHIFYDYVRQEYRIEELWKNGRVLDFGSAETPAGASVEAPTEK